MSFNVKQLNQNNELSTILNSLSPNAKQELTKCVNKIVAKKMKKCWDEMYMYTAQKLETKKLELQKTQHDLRLLELYCSNLKKKYFELENDKKQYQTYSHKLQEKYNNLKNKCHKIYEKYKNLKKENINIKNNNINNEGNINTLNNLTTYYHTNTQISTTDDNQTNYLSRKSMPNLLDDGSTESIQSNNDSENYFIDDKIINDNDGGGGHDKFNKSMTMTDDDTIITASTPVSMMLKDIHDDNDSFVFKKDNSVERLQKFRTLLKDILSDDDGDTIKSLKMNISDNISTTNSDNKNDTITIYLDTNKDAKQASQILIPLSTKIETIINYIKNTNKYFKDKTIQLQNHKQILKDKNKTINDYQISNFDTITAKVITNNDNINDDDKKIIDLSINIPNKLIRDISRPMTPSPISNNNINNIDNNNDTPNFIHRKSNTKTLNGNELINISKKYIYDNDTINNNDINKLPNELSTKIEYSKSDQIKLPTMNYNNGWNSSKLYKNINKNIHNNNNKQHSKTPTPNSDNKMIKNRLLITQKKKKKKKSSFKDLLIDYNTNIDDNNSFPDTMTLNKTILIRDESLSNRYNNEFGPGLTRNKSVKVVRSKTDKNIDKKQRKSKKKLNIKKVKKNKNFKSKSLTHGY